MEDIVIQLVEHEINYKCKSESLGLALVRHYRDIFKEKLLSVSDGKYLIYDMQGNKASAYLNLQATEMEKMLVCHVNTYIQKTGINLGIGEQMKLRKKYLNILNRVWNVLKLEYPFEPGNAYYTNDCATV